MFKKSLLSLAVASSLALTGCLDSGSSSKNANPVPEFSNTPTEGRTWPVFNPIKSQVPIPSDLIIDKEQGDGTYGLSPDPTNPVITALNELSGASTVAPIDIEMSGAIDADSVNTSSVFLIPLEYASGDPLQALSIGEPPTVAIASMPSIEVSVVEFSGKDFIRITPLKPLKPLTRYVVVVTNRVKDAGGQPLIPDTTYSLIASNEDLPNPRLGDVRNLVQKLWEPVATDFFQDAEIPLGKQNIALTFSLTTSGDEKVLGYIADPAQWFADTVANSVRVGAAKAAVAGGASDYTSVKAVVDSALDDWMPSSLNSAFAPCDAHPSAEGRFGCVADALVGNFTALDLLPTPKPRNVEFDTPKDATQVSAVLSSIVDPGEVMVVEGKMPLPYYLGVPTDSSGAPILTQSWTADTELAIALAQNGFPVPHADETKTTTVNYIFPFPKKQAEVTVPVLAMYPAGGPMNASDLKTVIFQHGITTDRSAALAFGSALIANSPDPLAVIAIDQPLHGVAPASLEKKQGYAVQLLTGLNAKLLDAGQTPVDTSDPQVISSVLNKTFAENLVKSFNENFTLEAALNGSYDGINPAIKVAAIGAVSIQETVERSGSTIPGLAATEYERHFDFTANAANQPVPMNWSNPTALDSSGSLFINLTNFTNTRDNLRQGVVDLLNLRLSIANMDLDGGGNDLDPNQVYFVGHSLGTVNGIPFVATANSSATPDDNIVAANMLTPGGGIVRMLENSPSFAPRILGGLAAAAGLQQGDADLETFFNVFQAAIDSVDPVNFADNLVASNSAVLLTQVNGDAVIPNSAYPDTLGNAQPAPLAGTEPLATAMGATDVTGMGALTQGIVRFTKGTHSTPALPAPGNADEELVFREMVYQTAFIIGSDGTYIDVANDTVIQK